jgi:hypothetical protein
MVNAAMPAVPDFGAVTEAVVSGSVKPTGRPAIPMLTTPIAFYDATH